MNISVQFKRTVLISFDHIITHRQNRLVPSINLISLYDTREVYPFVSFVFSHVYVEMFIGEPRSVAVHVLYVDREI